MLCNKQPQNVSGLKQQVDSLFVCHVSADDQGALCSFWSLRDPGRGRQQLDTHFREPCAVAESTVTCACTSS